MKIRDKPVKDIKVKHEIYVTGDFLNFLYWEKLYKAIINDLS